MSFSSWLPKRQRTELGARRRAHRLPSMRADFRPSLEALEDRVVPSTLLVTNNADTGVSGDGSLRGEIAAAQNGDTIRFAHSLAGQTITLNSELAHVYYFSRENSHFVDVSPCATTLGVPKTAVV